MTSTTDTGHMVTCETCGMMYDAITTHLCQGRTGQPNDRRYREDNVILPHPATPTSVEAFLAMLLENWSTAKAVSVVLIDDEGKARCFSTNATNATHTFMQYRYNRFVEEIIDG